MDPILPLGVLSGCLSAYAGVESSWVKRNSTDGTEHSFDPISPSLQPMKMKYLSNLFKDVEEFLNRMQPLNQWKQDGLTWWDEQFHVLHLDEEASAKKKSIHENEMFSSTERSSSDSLLDQFDALQSCSSVPGLEFQLKLPQDFKPLKSKFCGDSFQMYSSSKVRNPFMSPALADDELMKNLPHVDIVVSLKIVLCYMVGN